MVSKIKLDELVIYSEIRIYESVPFLKIIVEINLIDFKLKSI